ncbi:DUF4337 domain-containing protein [Paracraurococcus ruber]|uniref:DUF4337 domain-containing protein n=1 Tax=Paracraurococcus ruber TaxID=77675 RepID=A0ABS1D397_9PROT|nr:DUF4337 domain-containing protein [Paracraurococcus ruber]MBK1661085.1 hypothetical protein [Paracraurococcus ruber]TDG16651.1 DUF4337 domain-containing protein [Paracraurococcus ruber]
MAGHAHVDHAGDKRIALLIAILALFLALAETGAKSAQTEAISRNVEAANLWSFFQARTIRQTTLRAAVEETELDRATAQDPALREAIERQQKAWRDTIARWESEPASGEGRKELTERAKAAEAKRDRNMAAYHHYEFGAAAFQVAIVLASASIITGVPLLALGGIALGVIGVALTGVGFFAPEAVHL